MLFAEEKLAKRICELLKYRYDRKLEFQELEIQEDLSGLVNPQLPVWTGTEETLKKGGIWRGRDRYLWLRVKVRLPEEWKEKGFQAVGVFDFGRTGSGNNSGFESMLYIDGKPYQAVDSNHKEVFFMPEHWGRELTLIFRLWSGLEGGGIPREVVHVFEEAFVAVLCPEVDDLYYLADMMLQTVQYLPKGAENRQSMLDALDRAFRLLDWTEPGSADFYSSAAEADRLLNEEVDMMDKHSEVTIHCVGHTHIDTAWMWRLKHTREKVSRSFYSVLRLMERFPEYKFLHTQPQQYAYIKEDFPELFEEIKKMAAQGRWETDGAMWVEADCNLASGESLTRQLLLGRQFFLEEFEKEPQYLWLPDVFGYSWALPQILAKSGINMFMTTKISWNQMNRMPHDTFWWKGLDGTKILTHFLNTPFPGEPKDSFYTTYVGEPCPQVVAESWEKYRDQSLHKGQMISYGFGDGGGGVNRDMLERIRRMDRLPGLPHLKSSTAGEFFRELKEDVEKTDAYVHTWDGELYLEYHRGTYTTQAYNKRMNRRMENKYRMAEWLTTLGGILAGDLEEAQQEKLTEGWRIVLTHQFHDIIPGSSIREVYEDSHINYEKADALAEEVIDDFFKKEVTLSECWTILNPVAESMPAVVWVENAKPAGFAGKNGKVHVSQPGENGSWVYVEELPAMGKYEIYPVKEWQESAEKTATVTMDTAGKVIRHLETRYYEVELTSCGQLARLYDRENHREILASGQRGNVLQIFEDMPLSYDAWDIDIFYMEKMEEITGLTRMELVENGPVRTVIALEWKYHNSGICQNLILYADLRKIDFETRVDWHEKRKLLKVAFPVDIRATEATYDIQYGNVKRPTHYNTSWDMAKFEQVGHRFADISEYGYGVALMNDCKYGYDIHENVMRLSLLRGTTWPDYKADMGEHIFTYSLLPHTGSFVEGKVVENAAYLNQEPLVKAGKVTLPADEKGSSFCLKGAKVELDAVKKSENGKYLVIRFHEYAGARGEVIVKTGLPVKAWAESDLMERPLEDFHRGSEILKYIKPYEIITLLLEIEL